MKANMEALRANTQKWICLKLAKKIILAVFVVLVFDFALFSLPALANTASFTEDPGAGIVAALVSDFDEAMIEAAELDWSDLNHLPENPDLPVKKTFHAGVTAYNSEAAQCDASPCITANGFDLCKHGIEDSIATNMLPFGTKVKMPELFGDRVFVVRDRMNSRYYQRFDVWMKDKPAAIKFGYKVTKIEILAP